MSQQSLLSLALLSLLLTRLRVARGQLRRQAGARDRAAVRVVRPHTASRRSEGRHRGAAARRRRAGRPALQDRVLHLHLRAAADRGRHRGQDRLRDHRQHARRSSARRPTRRSRWCPPTTAAGVGDQILVHADSPIQSIADLRGKRIAVGKGSSAHGHILGQLNKAGLTPADVTLVFLQPADALVGVHQAPGRRVGDLGSVHRAGRGSSCRCAASGRPRASPTATGSVSRPTPRSPTRSATPRCPICWCGTRRRPAGRKDHPEQWAESYAAAVGLDPKVAAVAQGRSLRLPTELDDDVVASEQKLADLFAESEQIAVRAEVRRLGRPALQRRAAAPADQHQLGR